MILRPYQEGILTNLDACTRRRPLDNWLVHAVVGSGKSVMIGERVRRRVQGRPGARVVMAVRSKELCEQNAEKLLSVWPQAPLAIYSAGLKSKRVANVTYGTIGSLYRAAMQLGHVETLCVDEAHDIPRADVGMYRQLIRELRRWNPAMTVEGWTGTAWRGNGVWLHAPERGNEPLFHGIAASVGFAELLAAGFLSPLRLAQTTTKLDASGVSVRGGDYVANELAAAHDRPELVRRACAEIARLGAERRKWLVFGVTIDHCEHIAEELRHLGIDAAVISERTSSGDRDRLVRAFKGGALRALVNVATLTTGFDVPECDLIAMLRTTRSLVLYPQICGRGMRIATGKTDCLWLDFTSTTADLGPIDLITGSMPKLPGDAPIKFCPACTRMNPAGARMCVQCGHVFPPPAEPGPSHGDSVSDAQILSTEPVTRIVDYEITDIRYKAHAKKNRPNCVRVEYWSGMRVVASDWLHLDDLRMKPLALKWLRQRYVQPETMDPDSVDQFLGWLNMGLPLRKPQRLKVNELGRYPEIVSYDF